tara:strand:- start:1474 stop:2289 length:816 start_codon:yes stop_codon:yes gene_type:complete
MKVWIITVNYGVTAPTEKLIQSIENLKSYENIRIFIADNNSTDESQKNIKKIIKDSKLNIEAKFFEKNYFYWPAAKKILDEKILLKISLPDWICICNNDILFKKNFFNKLKKYNINKFNIIGPKIINSKLENSNPFMSKRISKKEIIFWNIYYKSFYMSRIFNFLLMIRKIFSKKKVVNSIQKVYAIHGSAMLISKVFFKKGGILDSDFQLFCEELSMAEISRKISCSIFFVPELELKHDEHYTLKNISPKKKFQMAKNSHQYFLSHYIKK